MKKKKGGSSIEPYICANASHCPHCNEVKEIQFSSEVLSPEEHLKYLSELGEEDIEEVTQTENKESSKGLEIEISNIYPILLITSIIILVLSRMN